MGRVVRYVLELDRLGVAPTSVGSLVEPNEDSVADSAMGMVASTVAKNVGRSVVCTALVLLMSTRPAAAYLDPGTGSMILQGLIGAVVGGLVALRIYWARIKHLFGAKTGGESGELDTAQKRRDESRPT